MSRLSRRSHPRVYFSLRVFPVSRSRATLCRAISSTRAGSSQQLVGDQRVQSQRLLVAVEAFRSRGRRVLRASTCVGHFRGSVSASCRPSSAGECRVGLRCRLGIARTMVPCARGQAQRGDGAAWGTVSTARPAAVDASGDVLRPVILVLSAGLPDLWSPVIGSPPCSSPGCWATSTSTSAARTVLGRGDETGQAS